MTGFQKITEILVHAKKAAVKYYALTGKPLGITGEVGECLAAQLLDLDLTVARTAGYDATDKAGRRIQIKCRCVQDKSKKSQRIGRIKFDYEYDVVMLVLLNAAFDVTEIYEADVKAVKDALAAPGSKARNERGALAVSKFKAIGKKIWPV